MFQTFRTDVIATFAMNLYDKMRHSDTKPDDMTVVAYTISLAALAGRLRHRSAMCVVLLLAQRNWFSVYVDSVHVRVCAS